MDKEVNKVRAVIINEEGKMLIIKTKSNIYMFPGGKIEGQEGKKEALQREIMEETGILVLEDQIEGPFCKTQHNGFSTDETTGNLYRKRTNTDFYIVHTDKPIDETKMKMTER